MTRRLLPARLLPARSAAWPWLVPALVLILVTTVWPLGRAVWTSLHRSALTTPDDDTFVGARNYTDLLTSHTWWQAVGITLALVVVAVVLQLAFASAFAATLRRIAPRVPVVRVLVLVPLAVLGVATASLWHDAVTVGVGPTWFGYDGSGRVAGLVGVLASEVWRGTGITTIILLAGLQRVSPSLLESVQVDGATARQRLVRVVLPAVWPAVAVAVAYRALDALRAFEAPLLAGDAPRTVTALVWDTTFSDVELGLGAAMSVLLLVLAGIVGAALVLGLRVRRVV